MTVSLQTLLTGNCWLQTEFMRVDIETTSLLAAGQTVCDVWGQSNRHKNVYMAKVYNELDLIHHVHLSCREQCTTKPFHTDKVHVSAGHGRAGFLAVAMCCSGSSKCPVTHERRSY